MLQKIIGFSIRNKLIIALFTLALVIWGSVSLRNLPIDAVPDITNNQVQIITVSPSLGAADIERLITFPIEQATRNIPGIIEQRSFSRFGLSLITIVFDDGTDVYWARNQVSERLISVQAALPPGIGIPELGPVTTGLGEIFQYTVRAKKGYEKKYTLADLRTLQDWNIRRQLAGTEGVADVSSFGGEVKQFEVNTDPAKLKGYGLTVSDVARALEDNNGNTGGAYIEKGPAIQFIRTEGLLRHKEDIENIPLKRTGDGIPLLIRDVAVVKPGHATRYGSMSLNGEQEVAGGIVMMIKGGNSSKVIEQVKAKIAQVQQTLPEGVVIEPFLDRTKMVNNAIGTVQTNLLEGALIVVFVLVVFLGNLRAGLLVASVIPLAMLFAVICMNLFGVSGNLMSLGALDFGLIVDGAVIIVEAVMHRLHKSKGAVLSRGQMDTEVEHSAGKMMGAAAFGQIIILVVYLPILALQGIEGKMFRPMAETVGFAILGAFILSLTYIPMMSAWLLSRNTQHKENLSDRMIQKLEQGYEWLFLRFLRQRKWVLVSSLVLFLLSIFMLSRMGGEFIPKLEEGDFAVEARMLPGTSLTTTIEATSQASALLKKQFPEVERVVTKTGSGEIPTDPMPIEATDLMVILKDKKQWTSAGSFDELAEKMSSVLDQIPGLATGFQYPVQMRFNELMTGARQDVVCKIYGENLDSLSRQAHSLGALIQKIDGARDVYVETMTGLPQIVVNYNRSGLARYGVSIAEVNKVIQSAFAGAVCGQVYENERRFDLVLRLDESKRRYAGNVEELLIPVSGGEQIPLRHLATVNVLEGPNQIQRENAQRRITIGFNVRGRDVQSIVNELQLNVKQHMHLPSGYYITYGGQFENLVAARNRLSLVVPVALLLILLLLYFAFGTITQGLLIFSAIPLSAIGGVIALWLRGMPFSISAGIGFIALFGVAVLNGIVLISEFNHLKKNGETDVLKRVQKGTRIRLRPVLMTAAVASLGFLPMAVSNGAGAEVQRPLATVVIGGLVSATALTLLVLPLLYIWLESRKPNKPKLKTVVVSALFLAAFPLQAQSPISLKSAIDSALSNHTGFLAQKKNTQLARSEIKTAFTPDATSLSLEYGNVNSWYTDNKISVQQGIAFPTVYRTRSYALKALALAAEQKELVASKELTYKVSTMFYDILLMQEKLHVLQTADSVYRLYLQRQKLRYEKGETDLAEAALAEAQAAEVQRQYSDLQAGLKEAISSFQWLLRTRQAYIPDPGTAFRAELNAMADTAALENHPAVQQRASEQTAAYWLHKTEKAALLPSLWVGYTNISYMGYQQIGTDNRYFDRSTRFHSIQTGIAMPLFGGSGKARVRSSALRMQQAALEKQNTKTELTARMEQLQIQKQRQARNLDQFTSTLLPLSETLLKTALLKLDKGEIHFTEWTVLTHQALQIRANYTDALMQYNETIHTIQSLIP
ncbi:MAG: CusA/CzcA family heavy metal efflux RND transporter [Bacteroidetes bacterium]|nr:CusA/CzcA family heavy metal efflux RND transporter [Bacteroidota bacterium]